MLLRAQILGGAHISLVVAQKLLDRTQMLLGGPIERASKEARMALKKRVSLSELLRYERELGGLSGCANNHLASEQISELTKLTGKLKLIPYCTQF